jgi:hypothetical protein
MRVLRSIRTRLLALVVATVVPFTALIGAGLWSQWESDQAAAIAQAINEARMFAARIDDHIDNLENLLIGVSEAVSTDPLDTGWNDALLRKIKSELPDIDAHVGLFSPEGVNIGMSGDPAKGRPHAKGRSYFEQIIAGAPLSIGDVTRGIADNQWLLTVARPVKDRADRLRAVLGAGTVLEHFLDGFRIRDLPAGTIVSIVNQKGIVVARSEDPLKWIGRDISNWPNLTKHIAEGEKEGIVLSRWADSDSIERVTAFSTAHRAPWLVTVGLPKNAAFAAVAVRLAWSAAFIIGTLIVGFSIAWVLSGRVIQPLR